MEIDELLQSMTALSFSSEFEVVIIEDGSTETSENVIQKYSDYLKISYYQKENSGPGDSRNYGMQRARGNYFLVLDSDVILPSDYLIKVAEFLENRFVHCFGGPDDAHKDFTDIQKAISFSMTSFLTTGGIRGSKRSVGKFQPRSFNMGISKEAFKKSNGFGNIHPGEDPDLTIRLWKLGYKTALIPEAKVFHKRRISWKKFQTQVYKFGLVRPILNKWHPETSKVTYWFPLAFMMYSIVSLLLVIAGYWIFLMFLLLYCILIIAGATIRFKNIKIGLLAVKAVMIQYYGYAKGFITSYYYIHVQKKKPEKTFTFLFFDSK